MLYNYSPFIFFFTKINLIHEYKTNCHVKYNSMNMDRYYVDSVAMSNLCINMHSFILFSFSNKSMMSKKKNYHAYIKCIYTNFFYKNF